MHFFKKSCLIFWSALKWRRHFFPSSVIFATATVVPFVLLRNSRFNFHCYTQREATPTQKLARKWRCDLSRLLARKITKGKPASLNRPTALFCRVVSNEVPSGNRNTSMFKERGWWGWCRALCPPMPVRDKLWTMHGSVLLYVQGSLWRKAQDGHLDFHTAPELWPLKERGLVDVLFNTSLTVEVVACQAETKSACIHSTVSKV